MWPRLSSRAGRSGARMASRVPLRVAGSGLMSWRACRKGGLGASSYTKSQVLSGLQEGDAVALPTEKAMKSGSKVEPVMQKGTDSLTVAVRKKGTDSLTVAV